MTLDELLRARLEELKQTDLLRRLCACDAAPLVDFASNDYLGLRHHPSLIAAAQRATGRDGAGAGASRLITGTSSAMLVLEEQLAAWKEKEASLIFSSGYAAALGTIPALVGPGDTVILDKLAHACLIDGARLSGATVRVFPHQNLDRLETLLRRLTSKEGRVLVVTESLFSMDGDLAPLRDLVELKDRHGAWLLVDEAHATGLYGPAGAGLVAEQGLSARVEIVMGTFSKALGGVGGYICGSRTLIEWLVNRARSCVYSTALPPGVIAASHAAIDVARSPAGADLRQALREKIGRFQKNLPVRWQTGQPQSTTAIQPLLCGQAGVALLLADALREAGYRVPAIRYPTVARAAARLRVTLRANHAREDIDGLTRALAREIQNSKLAEEAFPVARTGV